jgi:hypothetical protein
MKFATRRHGGYRAPAWDLGACLLVTLLDRAGPRSKKQRPTEQISGGQRRGNLVYLASLSPLSLIRNCNDPPHRWGSVAAPMDASMRERTQSSFVVLPQSQERI